MELETKNILKSKWFPWVVGVIGGLLLVVIVSMTSYNAGYGKGHSDLKATFNGKVTTYNQIKKKIEQIESDYKTKSDELTKLQTELASKQNEYDELKQLEANRDEMQQQVDSAKDELHDLKSQIKDAKNQLSKLQSGVSKSEGSPIKLSAGHFTVGKDIPSGRYKVEPVSGSGNFFVDPADDDYDRHVGVTLGNDSANDEVSSYVVELLDGDGIRLDIPAKFIPIE